MEFETTRTFDVLVVGGGIAGTTAALHAARSGARTAIACAGALFSGSSFYPGTWGLGLVGPESSDDEDDLVRAILEVGCGAALPKLVSVFVRDIPSAIDELEAAGVRLMRPDRPDEREFVPCFDRKHRLWRGIVRESYEEAVRRELERLGVEILPGRTLVDLVERDGAVAGAVLAARGKAAFEPVDSKATVLATGGFGGLFERRLTANDVAGGAHAVALAHGCALVNLEFMQMMPGLVSPKRGIVFNEKTFRHVALRNPDGTDPFAGRSDAQALLEERSGHGPFTARLASRAIDLAMDAAGPKGLAVRYRIGDAEDGAERRFPSSCAPTSTGSRRRRASSPPTSCASRPTPMQPTGASSSTPTDPAACRACSPAARRPGACTGPTASAGSRARTASCSAAARDALRRPGPRSAPRCAAAAMRCRQTSLGMRCPTHPRSRACCAAR